MGKTFLAIAISGIIAFVADLTLHIRKVHKQELNEALLTNDINIIRSA
jgi:hypothetical protein